MSKDWSKRGRDGAAYAGRLLLDTLLPPVCPGCGEEMAPRRWICGACRRAFRSVASSKVCFACRTVDRSGGDREAGFTCGLAAHRNAWGAAVFWMEAPLDAVVHAFKYGGREDLARPLGRFLSARVEVPRLDLVVPIPLHRTRLRERGYNQAQLLARTAAAAWRAPPADGLLVRRRATRAQARLSEGERAANVQGAFSVREPTWVSGRKLALVDDVATTGSTLVAAISELEAAGADRVIPVVLALA